MIRAVPRRDVLRSGLGRVAACLAHTAGVAPDGLTVVDVWESPEKFQAFGEKLMPLVQKTGLQPNEPIVYPAHNFVKE